MMSFVDLKEEGNKYFSKSKYDKAVACYSEALIIQPQNHLLFSNRSAAFIKQKLYQEALKDAVQCITLAPKFARGYLRKASALNGLHKYSEAMPAAEEGYKLRASDRICKDCIGQWLIASAALLNADVERMEDIPPGVFPVTKNCLELLSKIQQQHSSPGGISVESLQSHMFKVIEELECLLAKFGHVLSVCMSEWATALMQSLKVDPRTHAAPQTVIEAQKAKSKELVVWLDSEVDHTLYPVIRPVFALLTVAMLTCVSTLNQLLSSRDHIQILTKACLVFYKESILSTEDYLRLHIHAMKLLLNSFCMESGHAKKRRKEEATEIKAISQELKSLLGRYNPSSTDYTEVKESIQEVIGNAAILLSSNDVPVESFKRLTKEDAKMLNLQAIKDSEALKTKLSTENYLHFRDMDSLVLATGGLVYVGEIESAKRTLKQSESFYLTVITKLLDNKLLSINDAAECFFHPQTMMLCNAFFLAGVDDSLLADIFIRWKCLATELYALLARLGLSKSLMSTFNKIEAFKVAGKGERDKEEALVNLRDQHQKEGVQIVQEWGVKAIHALLDQSWMNVQKLLESDQLLLQYCMSPLYDTTCYPVPIPPKVLSLKGVVIAIRNEGLPIVRTLDFGRIQDLALESHNTCTAMKAVTAKCSGRSWQALQFMADKTASDLLQHMLPNDLQLLIDDDTIKRVYFCPDQILAKFPVEILPLKNGQRLGEKVAITYLSSARELLRESTLSSLSLDVPTHQNVSGTKPECAIFANPNFDLERATDQSDSHWSLLSLLLSSVFSESTGVSKATSLPNSESEAHEIEHLLTSSLVGSDVCEVHVATGDNATLYKVLQVQSPLILHFATHGFSSLDFHYQYHNFWSDTKSGLLLAGANTYRLRKYKTIADEAGTGELTALAACGMKLVGTRLVYLSSCRSSYGFIGRGEALSSLAQGFRIAGSCTVIATLWPISDEVGRKVALHFYHYACKRGMHVSLALQAAKKKLREEDGYDHWYDWAGFLCIGIDTPIFV